jgi:hypothetical protein
VGTTGKGRAIESLTVWTAGTGGACLAGNQLGAGWSGARCAGERRVVTVGVPGRGRLEAVRITVRTGVCAAGHVQGVGWQAWRCGTDKRPAVGGTTGQARRLEALRLTV